MRVITNSLGSGDWVTIEAEDGSILFEGHSITPRDFVDLINGFGGVGRYKEEAKLVEVNDEQMEEGEF
jgi:hypothetical protein